MARPDHSDVSNTEQRLKYKGKVQMTSKSPIYFASYLSGDLEYPKFVPEPDITILGHKLVQLFTATSTSPFALL